MNILKKYEMVALSNIDLLNLLNGKANVILYPQLFKFKTIDEVLGPYGACFLLFEATPRYGHWVALIKRNDTIEFFNSYGGYPDDTLKNIDDDFRKYSNQDYPYLSKLLLNSPYKLEYNEFDFQKKNKNIRTCGRWSAVRILLKDLNIYQFKDFINLLEKETGLKGDELVTLFTI